ncbi:ATP-binding protein [Streptomyces sp. NPDC059534]|uniref:ATP-binding protein n=1 Tax=Streptomyces sp. NPDC059534 TaxID=3346859 RepID=UPI003688B2E6
MEAHQITFSVLPTPAAVTMAHRHVRDTVQDWTDTSPDSGVAHTAEVVFSELATNAIRFAKHHPIPVAVRLTGAVLRMEVHDRGPALPAPTLPDDDSEGGRGLFLVGVLADRFGTTPTNSGKSCWAEIDIVEPSPVAATTTASLPVQRSYT